jgi:DNA helicase II / ATP-dependent DNA helicase PcrA
LIESYKKEKGEARIENMEELINAARSFDFDQDNEENLNEQDMFLAHAVLEAGDMQGDDY